MPSVPVALVADVATSALSPGGCTSSAFWEGGSWHQGRSWPMAFKEAVLEPTGCPPESYYHLHRDRMGVPSQAKWNTGCKSLLRDGYSQPPNPRVMNLLLTLKKINTHPQASPSQTNLTEVSQLHGLEELGRSRRPRTVIFFSF